MNKNSQISKANQEEELTLKELILGIKSEFIWFFYIIKSKFFKLLYFNLFFLIHRGNDFLSKTR